MTSTRAFAPASIGNVSLGFDVLGAAIAPIDGTLLGDWVEVTNAEQFSLSQNGRFVHKLPSNQQENIVTACYEYFQAALVSKGLLPLKVRLHLHKNLPIGSGLGSSAASIVAAFYALNAHSEKQLNRPAFSKDELLGMMGELEGQISGSVHYDNVAPSYLGGMTLMTGEESPIAIQLPVFDNWYWVSSYSGLSVSTAKARALLPKQYSLADALVFGRQLAVFVDSLHTNNQALAAKMMKDVIAEQHRKVLLPEFDNARAFSEQNKALSFGISGSGPTVFAVTQRLEDAQVIEQWLNKHYIQNHDGFSHICKIDTAGTRVITQIGNE
ncbi:MAG: homoserine kinase [Kangiellaceae bacterium]|jgi:homoserine kinase